MLIKTIAFAAALIAAFWLGRTLKKDNKGCGDYYEKWTPPGIEDDYDEFSVEDEDD